MQQNCQLLYQEPYLKHNANDNIPYAHQTQNAKATFNKPSKAVD
jgi:hypothetical protein